MELTGATKTKWLKLKTEIIKRPFLAYVAKLSESEVRSYFIESLLPTKSRLEEIAKTLIIDRECKTEKLRKILATKVGHRGSVRFANKLGISDGTIRNIIDRKYKSPPSYELLGQIETYLLYTDNYEVSLEHLNITKSFVSQKIDQLKEETYRISENVKWVTSHLDELKLSDKQTKQYFGNKKANRWTINQIQNNIDASIEQLKSLKLDIDTLIEDFCE